MRVLVLAGTGSIGGAVVDTLIAKKYEVFVLSRSSQSTAKIRAEGARPVPGVICRPHEWIDCVKGVDAVIHAAATWSDEWSEGQSSTGMDAGA